jgi:hypothetical protein
MLLFGNDHPMTNHPVKNVQTIANQEALHGNPDYQRYPPGFGDFLKPIGPVLIKPFPRVNASIPNHPIVPNATRIPIE